MDKPVKEIKSLSNEDRAEVAIGGLATIVLGLALLAVAVYGGDCKEDQQF